MTCDIIMTERRHPPHLRAVPSPPSTPPLAVAVQDSRLADFLAYWQKIRRGSEVPFRSDIDPRGIEPSLENAFVAERIAPGIARLRIAGNHLTDLMGMELRGMPLSTLIEPAHHDALSHHLVRLFDEPAMIRLSLSAAGRPSAPALSGEILILPLRSDLGDISRALGCLVTTCSPGCGANRFVIANAQITPIEGAVAIIAAKKPDAQLIDVQHHTVAGTAQPGRRPGYLKLIKG